MIKKIKIWILQVGTMLVLPASALATVAASGSGTSNTPPAPINTVQQLINLICAAFGWMFYGLIALSVLMVTVAGFNYVTAGDNSEKVSKATKMILYASIGVAVALLAKAIPLIVADFLNVQGSASISSC